MALDDILAAIRVVAAATPCSPRALPAALSRSSLPVPNPPPRLREIDGITEREREVLTLVGRGMSNGEIAAQLSISTATAKAHVAHLLTKLGARDRVQLVIAAYEAALAAPSR